MKIDQELNNKENLPRQEKKLEVEPLTQEQVRQLAEKLSINISDKVREVLSKNPSKELLDGLNGSGKRLKKQTKGVEEEIEEVPKSFKQKVNEFFSKIKKNVLLTATGLTVINTIASDQTKGAEKTTNQEDPSKTINVEDQENKIKPKFSNRMAKIRRDANLEEQRQNRIKEAKKAEYKSLYDVNFSLGDLSDEEIEKLKINPKKFEEYKQIVEKKYRKISDGEPFTEDDIKNYKKENKQKKVVGVASTIGYIATAINPANAQGLPENKIPNHEMGESGIFVDQNIENQTVPRGTITWDEAIGGGDPEPEEENNTKQQPDSTKINPEETPPPVINSWNNPSLWDENWKSGLLPQNTDHDIVWPKLDTLDFSRDGLPKDWRERKAYFNRGKAMSVKGYMPELSEEFINKKKITPGEAGEVAKKGIISSQQGTLPKIKGHKNTFDEEGNYLPNVSYHGGEAPDNIGIDSFGNTVENENKKTTESIIDIESKNSTYDFANLDKRTQLFFKDQRQLEMWKEKRKIETYYRYPRDFYYSPIYLQTGDNVARQPLTPDEIRGLPDFVFKNTGIEFNGPTDAYFPLQTELGYAEDRAGRPIKVNTLETAGMGERLEYLLRHTDWNDSVIKRENYSDQWSYTKAILDKFIKEGQTSIIINDAYKQVWGEGKINYDTPGWIGWMASSAINRVDVSLMKIPAVPEAKEQVREVVKKMAGIPSVFKHSKTPVEELMEKYPSLYSGLFDDPNIPFCKKGMTLEDLSKVDKLSKEQQKYINSEMLRAEVILRTLEVRDRTLSYMSNPAFVDKLMNRNIPEESLPKDYGVNNPKSKEYWSKYKEYSGLRDLMVQDLLNVTIPHIQEDRRGVYMDLAQGVPRDAMSHDQREGTTERSAGLFGTTTSAEPNLTQRHEFQHILNRMKYSNLSNIPNIENSQDSLSIVEKACAKFLGGYKKDQYDSYWEKGGEMDADMAQLKYNIIYDPIDHSVGGIVNENIDISQVAEYIRAVQEKYARNQATDYDPAMERIIKIWGNSTGKQKADFVKLMNKFN